MTVFFVIQNVIEREGSFYYKSCLDGLNGKEGEVDVLQPLSTTIVVEKDDEPLKEEKVEKERLPLPLGRSGGFYIPSFKLTQMMRDVDDKSLEEYTWLTWDVMMKLINGIFVLFVCS